MANWRDWLTSDPKVCHGQLCAKGTRVFVTVILDSLAEGTSREAILASYPSLGPEHIDAAIGYAAELARREPVAGGRIMKFKIDENLPDEIASDLRAAGHEADTVSDEDLTGADDTIILSRVQSENRVLLTMDKGIADVRAYPPDQYAGIILFRPKTRGRDAVLTFVRHNLPTLLQLDLQGHLFVVAESGIRTR